MLVLTRKFGETIRIGSNVELIINRIKGNEVSLAFDAPDDVKILRGELVDSPIVREDAKDGELK